MTSGPSGGARRPFTPASVRSRLVLEVASELAGRWEWDYKQVRLSMRLQGSDDWGVTFLGSDSPDAIPEVARGEAQVAIVNPSAVATLAYRGAGPFPEPIPLRAITVLPDYDQLAFAVAEGTGLQSVEEIRERRFPLRVSLRGQRDHSVHLVVDQVLAAAGFSLDDIVAWGGEVRYDPGLPKCPTRTGAVERGEIDAIFDEGVGQWVEEAARLGMRILPLGESLLDKLEAQGFRRSILRKAMYPRIPADVMTLDFSAYLIYTHADASDEVIEGFCSGLEARKDRIPPPTGDPPLPLERMCVDTPEGPLDIPLHPAAERFWRGRGYLD